MCDFTQLMGENSRTANIFHSVTDFDI